MADLIPAGRYNARAVDAQLGLSKGGSEQIGIGFEILDEGDHLGWHITGFFSFSDAAADYTFEKMRNAGWEGDDVTDLSSLSPSAADCSIVIKHEEYEGEWRAKVAFVNRPGTGKVKMTTPLEGGALASFGARMRAKAIASRGTGGGGGARPANGGATTRTARTPAPHPNAPGADDGGDPGLDSNGRPLPF